MAVITPWHKMINVPVPPPSSNKSKEYQDWIVSMNTNENHPDWKILIEECIADFAGDPCMGAWYDMAPAVAKKYGVDAKTLWKYWQEGETAERVNKLSEIGRKQKMMLRGRMKKWGV